MKTTRCPSVNVKIYVAGDIGNIREACRRWCFKKGACVTITPTDYVYTGGTEAGAIIGFINYPRFATTEDIIVKRAHELAQLLVKRCNQLSCTVEGPTETVFFSRREEVDDKIKDQKERT